MVTTAQRTRRPARLHLGLLWKIMLATLVAGLLPLSLFSYMALRGSQEASQQATEAATKGLDTKTLETFQVQAAQVAQDVGRLLEKSVQDTRAATLLPRTPQAYLEFFRIHHSAIAYPTGPADAPQLARADLPLYREIAYIDAKGREQLRIDNGQIVPSAALRDVSNPANTTYRNETYFGEARALPAGEVYVSNVTAWHTTVERQPASAVDPGQTALGAPYGKYEAVIRFATPVFRPDGAFDGVVVLSLDHRHIMEYVVHIVPSVESKWAPWPDYKSGNYAYMWDNDGYIVAHPLLSEIRGLDASGEKVVSPITPGMADEEKQQHTFNMLNGSDASREMHAAVLRGQSGSRSNQNQAGVLKANIYAPIPFAHGVYRSAGVFGGIAIGVNGEAYHEAANTVRESIEAEQAQLQQNTLRVAGAAIAFLILLAIAISRGITRPLLRLTEAARVMEQGEIDTPTLDRLLDRRVEDEVTTLTQVFRRMAEKVQLRERSLKQQIVELHIQIDEQKQRQQVAEITETDYFQSLQANAAMMRNRARRQVDG